MRRIVSKEERGRLRKRNQIIAGAVLVLLMVFSTLGFALQNGFTNNSNGDSGNIKYNGFEFVNSNGFWVLGQFVFRYNPNNVPDIGSGLKTAQDYQGMPFYIYSEDTNAESEIYVNMRQIVPRVQDACPEGTLCSNKDLPVKKCSDNFIIIKEDNISSIKQEDNCIYITGEKNQLAKLADQFLFKILGVR